MRFSDFVTLQRGFDLPKTDMRDGPFPVLGSTSVIGHHCEFKVEPPGVVTGRSGSLGVTQFINVRYWPHNTTLWVKDFKGNDPKFVYYQMQDLDFARFNAGAGVPTLNRNHLDSLEVDVPSLSVQQRIAGILSSYDELIENNQQRIKILESMARVLYREWFVHFRFPSNELVPLVPSALGDIPQGWEVKKLGEVTQFKSGFAFKGESLTADGPHRLVTIKNVQDGVFIPECGSRMKEIPERMPSFCLLNDGDILLSLTGNVGRVCLVFDGPFLLNQRVSKLVPVEETDRALVYCMFREPSMLARLEQISNGVAQQNLSPIVAAQLDCIHPPEDLRLQFSFLVEPMVQRIIQMQSTIQTLRRSRDLLLPRLLSGQIDVEIAS